MYAAPIQKLLEVFSKLPGVGPRTAERFVFYFLKAGKRDVAELAIALKTLSESIRSCEICWDFSDQSPCAVCKNQKRDSRILCVVAEPSDIYSIERARAFNGRYHVLRGTINQADEETIKRLKISELVQRLRDENFNEIILGFNPDVAGETTMLYIEQKIKEINSAITISRLARGLPMGSDLRYADDITLGSAITNRTKKKPD